MTDVMEFEAPFGFLGRLAETYVLERHLKKLLETRNNYIKNVAESEEWKRFLPSDSGSQDTDTGMPTSSSV